MANTFNIALLADPHIDYSYSTKTDDKGVNLRVRDGYNALKEIVNDIIANKDTVDIVVIAGDLFHTSHPTIRSIAIVQHLLRQLAKEQIPVHVLAGNHDSTDDRSYPAAVAVTHDPDRNIFAYYHPYTVVNVHNGINLHVLAHHGLHADDAPVLSPVEGEINILTTHGAAVDPTNATLMRCLDSPREQIIPPEVVIDENFHLKMLGHYHSRHAVGGDVNLNTWYAGSTLRRGCSDAPGARGRTLFKIHDSGVVEHEHHNIFQRPQYDLEVIDASNMTAKSIEDLVISNLAATQNGVGSGEFDPLNAPIVRQRVINATRSIRAGIDRKNVSSAQKHTLEYKLEMIRPENSIKVIQDVFNEKQEEAEVNEAPTINNASTATLDVMKAFTSWKGNSNVLKEIAQEYKAPVSVKAQGFLKQAKDQD